MFCSRMKAEGSRSACITVVLSWEFEDGGDLQELWFLYIHLNFKPKFPTLLLSLEGTPPIPKSSILES